MSSTTPTAATKLLKPGRFDYGTVIANRDPAWTPSGEFTAAAPRTDAIKICWTSDADDLYWESPTELALLTALPEATDWTLCYGQNCDQILSAGDLAQDCVDHWYCPSCAHPKYSYQ